MSEFVSALSIRTRRHKIPPDSTQIGFGTKTRALGLIPIKTIRITYAIGT
jgi:hypothetical protein